MESDDLKRKAEAIEWFHTMDLGGGVITEGVNEPSRRLPLLGIPEDLSGKRVLDIGAWDGFYTFECERRGAELVLATDSFCWNGEGWGTKAGFDLAHRASNSKAKTLEIDVLDMTPQNVGQFDLVLFLGVLYHMKHPLLCLEKVAAVTREMLILETQVDFLGTKRPTMAFYEGQELYADDTNWWGPNPSCIVSMLLTAGFQNAAVYSDIVPWPRRVFRAFSRKLKYGGRFLHELQRSRMVFHATKRRAY